MYTRLRCAVLFLLLLSSACSQQKTYTRFSALPSASSLMSLPLCNPLGPPRSWSVSVGIDQYRDPGIPKLHGASHDAWVMHHFFSSPEGGKVPIERRILLLNHKATRANFEFALGRFLAKACPQDTIYIYFAGHGAPEPDRPDDAFLFTYDTDLNNLVGTSLSMRQLPEFLKWRAGDVGHLVMLLDACHSGQINFPKKRGVRLATTQTFRTVPNQQPTPQEAVDKKARFKRAQSVYKQIQNLNKEQPKWSVITATSSTQLASEFSDVSQCPYTTVGYKGGLFTCTLIEGLRGHADQNKDGETSLSELHSFVEDRVNKLSNGNQTPQWLGSDIKLPLLKSDLQVPIIPKTLLYPPSKDASTLTKTLAWSSAASVLASLGLSAVTYQRWDQVNTYNNAGRATVSASQYEAAEDDYRDSLNPLFWSSITTGVLLTAASSSYMVDKYYQPSYDEKSWFTIRSLDTKREQK